MYEMCWSDCCISEEELMQRRKIMRLFHVINMGDSNCDCWKAKYTDGKQRGNDIKPDDLQPCCMKCLMCMYPCEDKIDKGEIVKFRDQVCAPNAYNDSNNMSYRTIHGDKTAMLYCDLVVGVVKDTKDKLRSQVIDRDVGLVAAGEEGPLYAGLPRYEEGDESKLQTEGDHKGEKMYPNAETGKIKYEALGLIGAQNHQDDVECQGNCCGMQMFNNKEVVTKTEFYRLFMHASLVIQANLFASLEEAYIRQVHKDKTHNATAARI